MSNPRLGTARRSRFWLIGLCLAGCTGSIEAGKPPGESTTAARETPSDTAGSPQAKAGAGASGPTTSGTGLGTGPATSLVNGAGLRPLRRLSRVEYQNTVHDLLGDTSDLSALLPADSLDGSTGLLIAGDVSAVEIDRIIDAADQVSRAAVPQLATILPCTTPGNDDACAREVVVKLGRRAYRRPLTATEIDQLYSFYSQARTDLKADFNGAIRLVIAGMLTSPNFLYHWEQGPAAPTVENKLVRLSPYEMAARLSYFLWSSMPDAELSAAADANALGTPAELDGQVRRMLASPKAASTPVTFYTQWLGISALDSVSKDKKVFPDFSAALLASMADETRAFVKSVMGDGGDRKLGTLLGASRSFVNAGLAEVYGLPGVTGDDLRAAALNPGERAGVLTQPAFLARAALANSGSPVKRGKFLREQLLCDRVPLAPANLNVTPPPPDPTKQTRELYVQHQTDASCKGCHTLMDPMGFAFETYDGIGHYRRQEQGRPVDSTGSVTLASGKTVAFTDAVDLVKKLAGEEQVMGCMTRAWHRFAQGRFETDEEAGSIAAATAELVKSGDLRELIVALTKTTAFRYREPATGEVLQ